MALIWFSNTDNQLSGRHYISTTGCGHLDLSEALRTLQDKIDYQDSAHLWPKGFSLHGIRIVKNGRVAIQICPTQHFGPMGPFHAPGAYRENDQICPHLGSKGLHMAFELLKSVQNSSILYDMAQAKLFLLDILSSAQGATGVNILHKFTPAFEKEILEKRLT